MRTKPLFTRRTTRVAASLSAAALATSLLTAATPTPDRDAAGCDPAWTTLPVTNDPASVADVDVVGPDDVWFAQNNEPRGPGSRILRWEDSALSEPEQQIPVPPRPVSDAIVKQASFDASGTGWALIGRMIGILDVHVPSVLGRFDGTRWSLTPGPASPKPAEGYLHVTEVVSVAPDDAWVIGTVADSRGARGVVTARWNGDEWQIVDNPLADTLDVQPSSVEVVSATDIYVAGYHRTGTNMWVPLLMHFDGTAWTKVALPPAPSAHGMLFTVDASGPNDVWVGGWTGDYHDLDTHAPLLMHWDGQQWSVRSEGPTKGPSATTLTDLYVAEPGEVWAIVERRVLSPSDNLGFLWRWDGVSWQAVWPRGERPLREPDRYLDVDGSGPDDVWVVGGTTFTTPADGLPYPELHTRRLISHLSCGGK